MDNHNMNISQRHYAPWKNLAIEEYFVILLLWHSRKGKTLGIENRSGSAEMGARIFYKRHKKLVGMMEMFSFLIVVAFTHQYSVVRTQSVHLKKVNFTAWKLYFTKSGFKKFLVNYIMSKPEAHWRYATSVLWLSVVMGDKSASVPVWEAWG